MGEVVVNIAGKPGAEPQPEHVVAVVAAVRAALSLMLAEQRQQVPAASAEAIGAGRWVVDGRAHARAMHDPMSRGERWGERADAAVEDRGREGP